MKGGEGGVAVGGAKRLGERRVQRLFCIHELAHVFSSFLNDPIER